MKTEIAPNIFKYKNKEILIVEFKHLEFEKQYCEKIYDLDDFKYEIGIDEILNDLNEELNCKNFAKIIKDKLIIDNSYFFAEIKDDEFIGKQIVNIKINFNEDYDTYSLDEYDINGDWVADECDFYPEPYEIPTKQVEPIIQCINEQKECANYYINYRYWFDVIVYLR